MWNLQTYYHFKLDIQKVDQLVNPQHQWLPNSQSVFYETDQLSLCQFI